MIRVLVVDDHAVVRAGICRLLDSAPDVVVVGQTDSGLEAVSLCGEFAPDVVVLELTLPDLTGLETTQRLLRKHPKMAVVVLTIHAHHEYLARLLRAGATGFVAKTAPPSALLQAVRKAAEGGVYVEAAMMERMVGGLGQPLRERPETALSNRELQVLTRLARGHATKEVAHDLELSRSTVETHRGRLLKKLGLRNNADLARFAIRRGLIDL